MRSVTAQTGTIRANALWGRGGRRAGAVVAAFALSALAAATAAAASPEAKPAAFVQPSLVSAAQQQPGGSFDVIVQASDRKGGTQGFVKKVLADAAGVQARQIRRQFLSIAGLQLTLSGRQVLTLARSKNVAAIVPDEPMKSDVVDLPESNLQKWAWVTHTPVNWTASALALHPPTIAVVDSGIDASRADFSGRVIGQVDLTSGAARNSRGDGYGHGTFVAGVAAGSAAGYAGVAPTASLVSLDVIADDGSSNVADVVAACDWILQNQAAYNIRVANFSLHAANRASLFFDPLDQAVERLWLSGVVVVAASGNYASDGRESGVPYAPGNDPFVITVGASDVNDTLDTGDDTVAPWSAWGYTPDGFSKPELSAPGRYVVSAVPKGAELMLERPDHVVADGYMQLSGTSFAAPAVAGTAALLLARHPEWTPDQVKGALMASATPAPGAAPRSLGVGELDVAAARSVQSAPNPNAGLDRFVSGGVFSADAWQAAARASAAWGDVAWGDAAWSDAAWSDAAWSDAAWASAAWGDAAWSDAAWSDAAWSDAAWSDAAKKELATVVLPATPVTDEERSLVEAALGIADPNCDPTSGLCNA